MQAGSTDNQNPIRGNGKYATDKPKECRNCYFWKGKRNGCSLKECYYILTEENSTPMIAPGNPLLQGSAKKGIYDCQSCPYGRVSPCIGYCIQKIMQEMRQKRQSAGKEGECIAGGSK